MYIKKKQEQNKGAKLFCYKGTKIEKHLFSFIVALLLFT